MGRQRCPTDQCAGEGGHHQRRLHFEPADDLATVADAGSVSLGLQRSPKRHFGPNMRPYLRVANVFEDRIDGSM